MHIVYSVNMPFVLLYFIFMVCIYVILYVIYILLFINKCK